ncbi:phage tail protein [Hymenobacter gummosus]|uniref:Phage tail protein n=1 Tax=Hymenobacter gummosus TaxID=1776032 RepID=A0A3S0J7S9_9BACT|nr:tail fiber protein [Hymenobacter gummosus]RTQ47178.1 phage tail protein [Hymenobacter gummosus]
MEPYLGEIRLFGFGQTPRGWMPCSGQLLPINQNQALFALLGTTYGGNGVNTFALPNLNGRVMLGTGQSASSGATYSWGQVGGAESVTLLAGQMPAHQHMLSATLYATNSADQNSPAGNYLSQSTNNQFSTSPANTGMAAAAIQGTVSNAGGSQAHENRQPFIAMNYQIAVQGIFPSRG